MGVSVGLDSVLRCLRAGGGESVWAGSFGLGDVGVSVTVFKSVSGVTGVSWKKNARTCAQLNKHMLQGGEFR